MANVIPMSGSGSRFADVGYILPKPLIPVSGEPMIYRVIDSLPPADKWVFVVRTEHVERYGINELIKAKLPQAIVVVEDNPTGQATSCMQALPYLEDDEDVFIAACDNSFLYDNEAHERLKADETVDSILWTFTDNPLLAAKPEAWGWVKVEGDGHTIADMSVKVPVSEDPRHDHAVVATFWYRRAADFRRAYELMVQQDYRVKGEFYVDSLPIFYKKLGLRSVIFDVDLYVGWGKPADLYDYEDKEYRYRQGLGPREDESDWSKWERYFQKAIAQRP